MLRQISRWNVLRIHNLLQRRRCRKSTFPGITSTLHKECLQCGKTTFPSRTIVDITQQRFCTTNSSSESCEPDLYLSPFSTSSIGSVDFDTDEAYSYFRTNLYPNETEDEILIKLNEANSVQDVFDILESLHSEGTLSGKYAAQALISIWDMQKFLLRVGLSPFDPIKDANILNKFIEDIRAHPTFQDRVLTPIISDCSKLEDEALTASLFCLKKLHYNIRELPYELFIEECLRRKDHMEISAISRLAVTLRDEGLYGACNVMNNFMPILTKYIDSMESDLEVRLVSLALRNSNRVVTTYQLSQYMKRLDKLVDKADVNTFESVTLCKILLTLQDFRVSLQIEHMPIARRVGRLLEQKVSTIALLDILCLNRFFESSSIEPYSFLSSLYSRIARLIEENQPPRLDLLSCIVPFTKNIYQRQKLNTYVTEYVYKYSNYFSVAPYLYKILRSIRCTSLNVYNEMWSKAIDMQEQEFLKGREAEQRKILKIAMDYLNFNHTLAFSYRNMDFEIRTKEIIYTYLQNFVNYTTPTFVSPFDVARALAFLVAFGNPTEQIFNDVTYLHKIDEMSTQFRLADLTYIGRGIDTSLFYQQRRQKHPTAGSASIQRKNENYYDKILHLSSIIEEQVSCKMLDKTTRLGSNELTTANEFISIGRLHLNIRKATGESPIFQSAITMALDCGITNSRAARDLMSVCLGSGYCTERLMTTLTNFIIENSHLLHPDVCEKFATLAYATGFNSETEKTDEAFRICYNLIEKHSDRLGNLGLLQCALALCYFRALQPGLVHNIFTVEYLDQVDKELSFHQGTQLPMKIRQCFMELNRAVCLELPHANVPWFHQKFCDDITSVTSPKETYLHSGITNVLHDVIGDPAVIQRNVYTPYYYLIDFLIEFDERNHPIKKQAGVKKKKFSFFSKSSDDSSSVVAKKKVAIIILPRAAFSNSGSAFSSIIRTLKGHYKLQKRHLEILNYKVIQIDPYHWNSMYMSEPLAKREYLETQIFQDQYSNESSSTTSESIKLEIPNGKL